MKSREYSALDRGIMALDKVIGDLAKPGTKRQKRDYPAAACPKPALVERDRQHIAGLMRVNHAGEIAAQALYSAQALTARDENLKITLQQSADEEWDHLDWCELRLKELDDHTSYLGPVWYLGSFSIGLIAGSLGDKWNLGFLAETEYQVVKHLDEHFAQLPENDSRSRAVLAQMREDELHHAQVAEHAGAKKLPKAVKHLMSLTSKVMTKTAYRI